MGTALLTRTGRRAILVLTAATVGVVAIHSPPARADLVNGVCTFDVTITFLSQPTPTGSSPSYSITVDEPSSECRVGNTLSTLTTSSASGSATPANGGTSLVKCGVLGGRGTWNQDFGGVVAEVRGGTHIMAGTWLDATLIVSGIPGSPATKFTGVIDLTPHPDDPTANATKAAACATGGSVTSIRMLGVQIFNDPEL